MKYPKLVLDQLRNKTCAELIRALEKSGFKIDIRKGARRIYRHTDGRRVIIDYHPKKTYGIKLFQNLLDDIGWSIDDLKYLKLIKDIDYEK